MKKGRRVERLLRDLLRRCLKVFPASFRDIYSSSMLETFHLRLRDARERGSYLGIWKCFGREAGGLIKAGLGERFHSRERTWNQIPVGRIFMKSIRLDARQAVRRLRTTPAFSFTVLSTLALAIGAAATIFTLVDGVLLRPLPYPFSEQLVELRHTAPGINAADLDQTRGTFFHYSRHSKSFQSMALYMAQPVNLIGDQEPERVEALLATGTFFEVLGAPPLLGRRFTEEDGRPGAALVAVLGHALWMRSFGGDPSTLGRHIQVAGVDCDVVGIMPEGFAFPDPKTQLWIPFQLDPDSRRFGGFSERAVGRLNPAASTTEAEAELEQLIASLPEAYPNGLSQRQLDEIGLGAKVIPLLEHRVGSVRSVLWLLLGSVCLVLLIAFLNVGNLFLVRAEGRTAEVAVRQALGAGKLDILRSYLFETGLLGVAGGALGLLLALAGIQLLRTQGPQNLPRLEEVSAQASTIFLCLGLALLAAIFLASVSALGRRLSDLGGALKDLGRGNTAGMRQRGKKILVGLQMALALVLLVLAALMSRSLVELRQVDPGFDPEGRLTFRLSLPVSRYPNRVSAARFNREFLSESAAVPEVLSVGISRCLPLSGWCGGDPLTPEGDTEQKINPPVALKGVNPDYFESLGLRLLSGRVLSWADLDNSTGATVISRSLGEKYWPQQDPLGKRFQIGASVRDDAVWGTVVGVVDDIRLTGLRAHPGQVAYFPLVNKAGLRNLDIHDMSYVVRSQGDPMQILPALRSRLRELNSELPMSDILTLSRHLEKATAEAAFVALMLIISALTANLLGALGVYAAMSYLVARQTNEIGVRMALGARVVDVGWMILREAGRVTAFGIGVGLLVSLGASRLLSAVLFEVSPTDQPAIWE